MPLDLSQVDFNSLDSDSTEGNDVLRSTFSEAMKVNPDEHAKKKQLSNSTGVPEFAVDKSTEAKFNLDKVDFNKLSKESPKTADYLSNFDNAASAHDDVDALQSLEKSLSRFVTYNKAPVLLPQDIKKLQEESQQDFLSGKSGKQFQLKQGGYDPITGEYYRDLNAPRKVNLIPKQLNQSDLNQLMGLKTPVEEQLKPLGPLADEIPKVTEGSDVSRLETAGSQFVRGFTSTLTSVPKTLGVESAAEAKRFAREYSGLDTVAADASAGDPVAQLTMAKIDKILDPRNLGFYKVAQSIDESVNEAFKVNPEYANELLAGQIPQGFGSSLAFIVGTTISRGEAVPGMMAGASLGYTANAQSQFEDALNSGASLDQATESSRLAGVMGISEVVPISKLLDRIDKGTGGSISRAIKESLKQGTEEATQEAMQTIWSNVIASDLVEYDPDRKVLSGVGQAAGAGFTVGALFTSIGFMVTGGRKRTGVTESAKEAEDKSQFEQRQIDQINENATESKLRQRNKEAFRQFVEQADSDNNSHVFIDGTQVSLYLQDKTKEEIDADPALKLLSDQSREAGALGSDVQIPVADFAADIAGTDHFENLRDSMTMSEDTIAPFRQEQAKKETESYIENLMNEAQQNVSEYADAQEIYTKVRDQLVDTGQVTPANASIMAQVVPAWATAQAQRQGKSVAQVYQEAGLIIEGPQTGERTRLEGEQVMEQGPGVPKVTTPVPESNAIAPAQAWKDDHAKKSKKLEMTAEQAAATAPTPDTDSLTGLFTDTELLSTIGRAKAAAEHSIYVESDTFNLGGLNKALGANVRADAVLKQIADAYAAAFPGVPVYRRGAGRFAAIVPVGFNINEALTKVNDSVESIVKQNELAEIPAPKVAGAKGVSLYSGQTTITSNATTGEIIGNAQQQIEAAMPRGDQDVNRDKTFQTWATKSAGQAEGVAARVAEANRPGRGEITAVQGQARTEALERTDAKPTAVERSPISPDVIREENHNRIAKQVELTPEQSAATAPVTHRDPLTGWFTDRDRKPTMARAQQFVEDTGGYAAYVVADISNLGGLNLALGNQVADVVFRNMAQIIHEKLSGIKDADVVPFRHGGDEISFVLTNAKAEDIRQVMNKAAAEVSGYVEAAGLKDLPHAKDLTNEKRRGSGIYVGVQSIDGIDTSLDEIIDAADARVEVNKKRPLANPSPVQIKGDQVFQQPADVRMIKMKDGTSLPSDVISELLNEDRWFDRGLKIRKNQKVYRGTKSGDPFSRNFESGASTHGRGLYTTTDKKQASEYGTVSEMPRSSLPSNPIRFRDQLAYENWTNHVRDALGYRRESEFSNLYKGDDEWIRLLDPSIDGVQIGEGAGSFFVKFPELTFEQPSTDKVDGARGYYDPANSIIRLQESADLSTFLHEFAHFMYEMEVKGDTEMLQSINAWYKRNAKDVAKEANEYLGKKFSAEKQLEQPAVLDMSKEARLKRAEAMGFDTSTVYYVSVLKDTKQFNRTGKFMGYTGTAGISVTDNPELASRYLDRYAEVGWVDGKPNQPFEKNVIPVYIKKGKVVKRDAPYKASVPMGHPLPEGFVSQHVKEGYDTAVFQDSISRRGSVKHSDAKNAIRGEEWVLSDPSQIRSINAAFEDAESADLLAQPQQPPKGKAGTITESDVTAFLDNKTTGDRDKDAAIRRALHEQFARGFEAYLMEGKAPSIELRNAFRTFARWLGRIYQAMRGRLNVNLDDEMRAVFDRMLATEEQIQAAIERAKIEPMFTDAAMAGMTEEEFADYQKRQEKVKDVQTETLRDKLIKQLTRQTEAWWKEEKQDLIDEERETLSKRQVYTARARLRDGDMKLDHATVKEMAGEMKTNKLGRTSIIIPSKLIGMTKKGAEGVHPDVAAAYFGYRSGSEMLRDLVRAPSLKEAAEANAEARMVERHGDIMNDGTIEKEADEAVQNEERGKLILHELKMISRGTKTPKVDRAIIKSVAEDRIGRLSFREIHPGKYRKAEINAAQEAARMLTQGNREGAAQAKMRQVMNYYLGMAATNAKNDTVKIVDRMARYNKKKVREQIQKAEGGYLDQIDKILNRFEFRKSATLKEVESLNTWVKERTEVEGDGLVISNAVLNESYVTHWKNVPFSDLQGINDSVKNIEHVARYANKLTRMQEELDFNQLVDRWTGSMEENVKTRFKSKRTDVAEGRNWGRWAMAQMTKIPFMASWLDGGERAGISHQVLVQPFTEAYDAEVRLWAEAGKPVMDLIEGRSKADMKRHNKKIYIPEIDDNLYGHQVLAVALNTGNQSNLKKLLLGEGWANPDNDAEITFENPKLQAVLQNMTKSDWELVQKIWDQMETLYPKLAEVHRRTTGLTPPKIESTPVVTEHGTFRGGYYPVKYDPNRDHRAAINEDKLNAETESMFSNGASIQASVNAGATNERTGYYAPIRLSLDVVPAHFQETIHYITHHDPVREVNRLIRNKKVATTIKEKLGPEEYAQLKPWLNDIAKDGREAPTKMFWDSMLQRLRFGVTLGTMGFKASTGIIQISGLSNTVAETGLGPVMQSMRSILGSTTTMKQAWQFAVENSKVMAHRTETMDREIKNAMKRIEGKRGLLAATQEVSMKHIALIQTYMVDLPSWHAAYIKGMKEWGDETRAYQYADWVVENVQGSGVTKDMARIMRGQTETGRMFTMFMTFFSSLWNMERDLIKGAKSGRYSTTNVAAKAMFLFTIPVVFEMLMRGELGEPDDEDDRLQKVLTGVAMYPVQSIPFVRDIANATTGEYGYNISPLQSIIEQGTRTIPQLVTDGFTDEEITKGQVKGATKFVGAAAGIPGVNQMWATGEHLYNVIVDGEDFTMRELLFGPDRE